MTGLTGEKGWSERTCNKFHRYKMGIRETGGVKEPYVQVLVCPRIECIVVKKLYVTRMDEHGLTRKLATCLADTMVSDITEVPPDTTQQ
jgi:hypothetical protein